MYSVELLAAILLLSAEFLCIFMGTRDINFSPRVDAINLATTQGSINAGRVGHIIVSHPVMFVFGFRFRTVLS